MAYTDDWESLMNGVFGPGGKLKFSQSTPRAAQPKPEKPEKTQDSPLPDWNAALLARQKKLDEMLKQQNAALKGQDAATKSALEDSRKMLRDLEEDGLLAKGTADAKPEHLGSFEGLADEVKKTVLGQDAFVEGVARAMRRPFVLGTEPPAARNVVLLCGGTGTGRHFALTETARCMAARGLLRSDQIASLDLASTPTPGRKNSFCRICTRPCTPPVRSWSLSTTKAATRASSRRSPTWPSKAARPSAAAILSTKRGSWWMPARRWHRAR